MKSPGARWLIKSALWLAAWLLAPHLALAQPFVPITDLTTPYLGVGEPGLYPGGLNVPSGAHLAYGIAQAAMITPRLADGTADANGLIGLVLLGISNANQEGARFEREADAHAEHAGRVVIVDAAQGGVGATEMDEASDPYWSSVFDHRLAAAGVDPDQVQAVWLKTSLFGETSTGAFPQRIEPLRTALRGLVGVLAERCPNLRLIFVSSRIWKPVPTFAYETGFAVKALIQDQLDDVGGLGSGPWIGWGPYLWADGTTPRLDGFTWQPEDIEGDGVHPAPTAEWKVANLLRRHLREHPLATGWYPPPDTTAIVPRDAVADAVVDPALPSTPDGTGLALAFDGSRRIYLKFDLSGLTAPVLHAKLSLLVDPTNAVSGADLHHVADDTWSESLLTWNNAPPIDPQKLLSVPNYSRGGAWSADVTAAVETARQAGDPAITFALLPPSGGLAQASFLSREANQAPRLILTLDQPPTRLPIWTDGFESGDTWFWQ